MSRVIHFEIHASQPAALILFYEKLFGWTFSCWGDFPYWLVDTGPAASPGINGGLLQRQGPPATAGQGVNAFVCTVDVANVEDSVALALRCGGELAVPKMAIAGVGWLAYVKDPDGNLVGLMQASADAN